MATAPLGSGRPTGSRGDARRARETHPRPQYDWRAAQRAITKDAHRGVALMEVVRAPEPAAAFVQLARFLRTRKEADMTRHALWAVRRARQLDKWRARRGAETPHFVAPTLYAEAAVALSYSSSRPRDLVFAEAYLRALRGLTGGAGPDIRRTTTAIVSAHLKRGDAREAARCFERVAGDLIDATKVALEGGDDAPLDALLLSTGVAAHARSKRRGSAHRALELLQLSERVAAQMDPDDPDAGKYPSDAAYATTALALYHEGYRSMCRRVVLTRAPKLTGSKPRVESMFVPLIAHSRRIKSAKSAVGWYNLACRVYRGEYAEDGGKGAKSTTGVPINVANAAIAALANCETLGSFHYVRALQIFDEVLESAGSRGARSMLVDGNTAAPLLRACARTAQVATAERVVRELRVNGYRLSLEDLTGLISCYGRAGKVAEAEAIFELATRSEGDGALAEERPASAKSRYEILASYDSIDDDEGGGASVAALELEERADGVAPVLALLYGSPRAAALAAKDLSRPDAAMYNAMIDAYARNMLWEQALGLFGRMEKELSPTIETYNSLINACARANQSVAAIGLFSRMRLATSLRPTHRTINPLLAALAANDAVQDALDIYEEMERREGAPADVSVRLPPPNKRTYLTVMSMLGPESARCAEVRACAVRRGFLAREPSPE